jgi:hypothetical protein
MTNVMDNAQKQEVKNPYVNIIGTWLPIKPNIGIAVVQINNMVITNSLPPELFQYEIQKIANVIINKKTTG